MSKELVDFEIRLKSELCPCLSKKKTTGSKKYGWNLTAQDGLEVFCLTCDTRITIPSNACMAEIIVKKDKDKLKDKPELTRLDKAGS